MSTIFQSTLPQGERLDFLAVQIETLISIHAPTRGATTLQFENTVIKSISIHAPTRGATRQLHCRRRHFPDFNPRSHKGSDVRQLLNNRVIVYFNPRSHKGSDTLHCTACLCCLIFQSTLPQGERPVANALFFLLSISIHAPTRGATQF